MQTNDVFTAAMQLPEAERFDLVARLMDSLPLDDSGLSLDNPELLAELDRRFADSTGTVPLSELRAE